MITRRVQLQGGSQQQGTVESGRAPPGAALGAGPTPDEGACLGHSALCRPVPPEVPGRKLRVGRGGCCTVCGARAERKGVAMASSGVTVNPSGPANEAPEIPDNVGDWLRGVYRFATDRNDFRRNLILNLGLFAAGVWLARNLSDIDLMAPQPGV